MTCGKTKAAERTKQLEQRGDDCLRFILSAVIWERFLLSNMQQAELVPLAERFGCAGVEFRPYWRDSAWEVPVVRESLEDNGLVGVYACNEYLLADSGESVRHSLLKMTESMQLAKKLGAGLMRIHVAAGSFSRKMLEEDWWQKAVGEVIELAADEQILLALENAPAPGSGDPALIGDILKGFSSPWLKATFDTGNWLAAGWDPAEALDLLKGQIGYVHLKDMAESPEGLAAASCGSGIIEMRGLIDKLNRTGYQGFYALEFPGGKDPAALVEASLRYMRYIRKS